MKHVMIVLILIFVTGTSVLAEIQTSINVQFADDKMGRELVSQEDDFTKCWSQFDIHSRLGKTEGTKAELFEWISEQVRSWSDEEKERVGQLFNSVNKRISNAGFQLNVPASIALVKTTGVEEGGASAYTRSNYIVISESALNMNDPELEKLLIHELFHIISRHDAKFRLAMYQIIGFSIANEIAYHDKFKDLRITNPDAPQTDSYIQLDLVDDSGDFMMVLYADKPYSGGSFFNYLQIGFMRLQVGDDNKISISEESPLLYGMKDVAAVFFDKIGKNTQYILHPEEIMADNFALAVIGMEELPSQWIVDEIGKVLSK